MCNVDFEKPASRRPTKSLELCGSTSSRVGWLPANPSGGSTASGLILDILLSGVEC
jgi:hypothetical protein